MKSSLLTLFSLLLCLPSLGNDKPNILWIYVEDLSPWFGCYGDSISEGHTPVVDGMAEKGALFTRCMMPSPTCSTTRSALITGTHQGTFGLHNHRMKSAAKPLPEGIKTIPELFIKAGYETFNQGKTDYNFKHEMKDLYTISSAKGKRAWEKVPAGKPWFGQIQLSGGKGKPHKVEPKVTAEQITLPPYLPNEPVFIEHWVHHYNNMRLTDQEVGQILGDLKEAGMMENTIVFFFSDHGNNQSLRHKQFVYEGGVHVPLVIIGEGVPMGERTDLVSGIDISTTTLALAGIDIPDYMQGDDLFSSDYQEKDHVVSARDRCDFTIDQIRSVRTEQFRYLKNGLTDRVLLQPQYRDKWESTQRLRALNESGELGEIPARAFFGQRPSEELYDLEKDPHQVNNLAGDPSYKEELEKHRSLLENWIQETGDQGQKPEGKESLKVCLDFWKERCVNPEFDAVK